MKSQSLHHIWFLGAATDISNSQHAFSGSQTTYHFTSQHTLGMNQLELFTIHLHGAKIEHFYVSNRTIFCFQV
jgi:hypothetical protein